MWALIIFAHVGTMGTGNSNALTTVQGFTTVQMCQAAGDQARRLVTNTVQIDGTVFLRAQPGPGKEINFVCVQLGR